MQQARAAAVRGFIGVLAAALIGFSATVMSSVLAECPQCFQCTCVQLCCDGAAPGGCASEPEGCDRWTATDSTCEGSGGCSFYCGEPSENRTFCCNTACAPN